MALCPGRPGQTPTPPSAERCERARHREKKGRSHEEEKGENKMFLRILKNDLRRKKTMNIILLLFVILSSMFASSSVSNISAVMSGTDSYFDKAGMSDAFILTLSETDCDTVSENLDSCKGVDSYQREDVLMLMSDNFRQDGNKLVDFTNAALVQCGADTKMNIFDDSNEKIKNVKEGECYISGNFAERADLEVGERFDIKVGDNTWTFTFAGHAKDALFGSEFINNPRFLLSSADYEKMVPECQDSRGAVFYIDTDDADTVLAEAAEGAKIQFSGPRSMIKTSYIMNMIVAALLLVVSVGLIVVSFIVLRFTIGFTIAEEFREIGVMKAIGLKTRSIRGLYLVKYTGIAVLGAVLGFFAGIPFGRMLLDSAASSMVLGGDNTVLISALSSAAVVAAIIAFSWRSTKKIKKLSPVDAVRSGQTGERFKKRGILKLGSSRLGTTSFMALNDVFSAKKQFGIICAVFTVCILLVTVLANTANFLSSEKMLPFMALTESDVYINDTSECMDIIGAVKTPDEAIEEVEQKIRDAGYDADVSVELWYKYTVAFGDKSVSVPMIQNRRTKTEDYSYEQGTAPQYTNEIALSLPVLEKLGAKVGDTVTLAIGGEDKEFIVTASYQSMNNLGESGRFHQDYETDDRGISTAFAFQADFKDDPDAEEIDNRVEKLKDAFETDNVFNSADYAKDCSGAADTISAVKYLVLVIDIILAAMIAVLMERSFISKEKSEIALLKAMGFKSRSVIFQHTLRFVFVCIAAAVFAAALCIPLTKLTMDPIFSIMGLVSGIEFKIDAAEVFFIYPLIMLGVTALAVFLTSLYTASVKASDTADIE